MRGGPAGRIGTAMLLLAAAALSTRPCDGAPPFPTVTESSMFVNDVEDRFSIEAIGWVGLRNIGGSTVPGSLPVTLRIVNGGDRDVVVSLEPLPVFDAAVMPVGRIVAPAGATTVETVFIEPLPTASGSTYLSSPTSPVLSIDLVPRGSGSRRVVTLGLSTSYVSTPSSGTVPRLYTEAAIERMLPFAAGWGAGPGFTEGIVDLSAAPADWRGWSAIEELVILDADWERMAAATRQAALEWLSLGGRLRVLADDLDPARLDRIGLPRADADGVRRVGAGVVIPIPADADSWALLHGQAPANDTVWPGWQFLPRYQTWEPESLALAGGITARELPFGQILAFLALFALLAGPINVSLAARGGTPSRIFWTTPLLALAATALLGAIMLLRDGVGGQGIRRTLCLIDPDHVVAAVLQEQFSRTGVLAGGSFPIAETSRMRPEPTTTAPLPLRSRGDAYGEADGVRRGDWFRSRSDQAFSLAAVRPHRGRIDLTGDETAPSIVSSIDAGIENVLVRDARGRLWRGGPVGAGQSTTLVPATEEDLEKLIGAISPSKYGAVKSALERLRDAPGYAWAEAAAPARVAIATHGAIRWTDDRAWFVLPVGRRDEP